MQYCELMFSENTANRQYDSRIKSRLSFRDKRLYYKISAEIFTGDQIYEMVEVIEDFIMECGNKCYVQEEQGKVFTDP